MSCVRTMSAEVSLSAVFSSAALLTGMTCAKDAVEANNAEARANDVLSDVIFFCISMNFRLLKCYFQFWKTIHFFTRVCDVYVMICVCTCRYILYIGTRVFIVIYVVCVRVRLCMICLFVIVVCTMLLAVHHNDL